jgi:hypothetical protein
VSYAIIRSGIIEHLLSGKLSLFDLGIYTVVHLQADFKTGIWRGSAPRILGTAPAGTSLRAVQRAIENLTEIRFLRTFRDRGVRGNFPYLVDKYDVRIGALKGLRLNAWKSESWQKPCYERDRCGVAESDRGTAPYQYVSRTSNQEEGKTYRRQKQSPADPRHPVVFLSCHDEFQSKFHQKPTWGGKDRKKLSDFLREHPSVAAEDILRRYRNLLDSGAHFHAEKHGSLFHLLSNFDVFMDGPVFDRVTGGSNGNNGSKSHRAGVTTAAAVVSVLGSRKVAHGIQSALPTGSD